MRRTAILVFAAAILGSAPVTAADVAPRLQPWAVGIHAGPLAVYDYEPGVVVRAYWAPPWGNRHYYPSLGHKPRLGRRENVKQRLPVDHPEDFYREWSSFPLPEELRARPQRYLPSEIAPAPVLPK